MCSKCCIALIYLLQQPYKISVNIVPVVEMRKQNQRGYGHSKWQRGDSNPGSLALESLILTTLPRPFQEPQQKIDLIWRPDYEHL